MEVKCPFSAKDGWVNDLLDQRNGPIVRVDGELELNRKHNYFSKFLVGLQLHTASGVTLWLGPRMICLSNEFFSTRKSGRHALLY